MDRTVATTDPAQPPVRTDGGSDDKDRGVDEAPDGGVTGSEAATSRRSGDTTVDDPIARVLLVGIAAGIAVFALLLVSLWTDLLTWGGRRVVGELGVVIERPLATVGNGLGMATATAVYLILFDRGRDFLDLEQPARSTIGYAVLGALACFTVSAVVTALITIFDVPVASHSVWEDAQAQPAVLLVMILLALVIIGPAEELVFRNVIQKSLYDAVPVSWSIAIATVLYVGVHVLPTLASAEAAVTVLPSVVVLTAISVVFGVLYARTGDLLVPALAHGLYDALLFLRTYLELVGVL